MKGWVGLALFATGYDLWASATGNPTLSTTFRQVSVQRRVLTLVGSAYLLAHLHGFIPTEHDPLGHLGRQYDRRLGGIRARTIPV